MALSAVTQAATIKVSSDQKTFKTFSHLLSQDVDASEKLLRVFMEDSMGCSRIRMNLDIIKEDGLFTNGVFVLGLSANCDSSIHSFKLDFEPLCTRENQGEAALSIQFIKEGRLVSKRFIIENSSSCQE
jgi:hypothetical protein